MFSGSGYTTRLLRKLPDVRTHEELKMAAIYRKLICAIFDSSQIHTTNCLCTSPVLLPDPKNMGIAVGMSLLSCIEAEICIISYLLPVDGCHLRFPTYPDVGQYSHLSLRVARPRKLGYSLGPSIEADKYVMSFLLPVNGRYL